MAISIKKQSRDLNSDSLALKVAAVLRHSSDLVLEGAGHPGSEGSEPFLESGQEV